jgi:hypothetical protein
MNISVVLLNEIVRNDLRLNWIDSVLVFVAIAQQVYCFDIDSLHFQNISYAVGDDEGGRAPIFHLLITY